MDRNELINRFTYHPPTPEQIPVYERIRQLGRELALELNDLLPEGREKSLAMTHLDEVVMCANAAVARCTPSTTIPGTAGPGGWPASPSAAVPEPLKVTEQHGLEPYGDPVVH